MSAMGGMFAFGGGPADAGLLAALGSRLERLGPDGGREATAGSVGMAYRAFHTNAESRLERQPLTSGRGCLLTWDGRLDNREELVALLRDELRGDRTDVAIVQAAYVRWGTAAFGRIVGDFALALWDSGKRALFLARDCVGTRTLYYHVNHDRILWSTDLGPLLDVSGVPLEVNDEYVAGFLTRGPGAGLTPYVNVHAVKPAFFLRVDVDGLVSEHRFWALDPDKEIRYRTDAEYEEHFRHLFREAVRVRLRSDRPVFAELSGGLDSSSIVCMADDILRAGEAEAPRLETVSYVFDVSTSSDERKWIEHVERHRGRRSHHIRESLFPYLMPLEDDEEMWTLNPVLASSSYENAARDVMQKHSARVLLAGQGGDEMLHSISDPTPELADFLSGLNLLSLHSRIKTWAPVLQKPYLHVLWDMAFVPVLPRRIRPWFKRGPSAKVPYWIDRKFADRRKLRVRMLGTQDVFGCRIPSRRDEAIGFLSVANRIGAGYRQELGRVRISYPYMHRPLVEFLVATPFSQKVRPRESRSLMRRSLAGLLPESTRSRRGKGNPTEVVYRAVAREAARLGPLFDSARSSTLKYVEPDALALAMKRAAAGNETYSAAIMNTITLEFWLRALERRRASTWRVPAPKGGMHPDGAGSGRSSSGGRIPGRREGWPTLRAQPGTMASIVPQA